MVLLTKSSLIWKTVLLPVAPVGSNPPRVESKKIVKLSDLLTHNLTFQ